MTLEFEYIAGPIGNITEGPAWDGTGLLFTDIDNSRIWRYTPDSGSLAVYREGTNRANGLMFDATGRLFACEGGGRCIALYPPGGPAQVIAAHFEGKRLNSPNDLAIDSYGRIWFTDPRYGNDHSDRELDHESVYRLDPPAREDGDWKITRVTFDTTKPNGILISPDEQTLYVAQSDYAPDQPRQLRAYPIRSDRTLGPYRVLHEFGPHRGIDGMCMDADGNVLAATGWQQSGPGPALIVFAPDGTVLERHPCPQDRPTNCTFAGPDLTDLYVTFIGGWLYRVHTTHRGRLWWPRGA
ncbi:MAG: SMP-30/gluconolactonase/LRE family protein [Chloroflexi bacterium]|nr:SMP-30/gluconolactonase/LRE family protein [Chloroflexota bacterium]